jgi:hypothetical protein
VTERFEHRDRVAIVACVARSHCRFLPRFTSEVRMASMTRAGSVRSLVASQSVTAARTTAVRGTSRLSAMLA